MSEPVPDYTRPPETPPATPSLSELNQTWHGSARDATPQVRARVGEIRRQWHGFVAMRVEMNEPLRYPVDTKDLELGIFEPPPPLEFAGDVETGESLYAYAALTVSYYPPELGGLDRTPQWRTHYHPFRADAEALNGQMVERYVAVMEAYDLHDRISGALERKRREVSARHGRYINELAKGRFPFERPEPGQYPEHDQIQQHLQELQALQSRLVQAAVFVTGDPQRAEALCLEAFKGFVPKRSADRPNRD